MNMYKLPVIASFIFISSQVLASQTAVLENVLTEMHVLDGNVSIEWIEPKKFRDVKDASMSRKRYREKVFAELEEYFTLLGKELPEGQKLNIKVTDLDMAGTVQSLAMAGLTYNLNDSINDYRIMRDIDIPRMTFSYELIDETEKVIKQDEVLLKDMSYLTRSNMIRKNAVLRYEKAMISRWFQQEFENQK